MAKYLRSALLVAVIGAIIWTCGGTLFPERRRGDTTQVIVYGFSILSEVLNEEIFPLFQAHWRHKTGGRIQFVDSFNASGTVANQVVLGAPADIAIFSHPGDADRVWKSGAAYSDWRTGPNGGIVNRTPILIATRKGNPKAINGFGSLGRPDVQIVHPDPLTSGGAQWAILAEFAEPIIVARSHGRTVDEQVGYEQLLSIWRNVTAQAASARAARTQFDQGFGDAIVTYEVELLLDQARGKKDGLEIVVPRSTILCEHPVVLLDRNISESEMPAVKEFYDFLFTEPAQRAFVRHGFRSIYPALDAANPSLARVEYPFTVDAIGGWTEARERIVEQIWKGRVLAEAKR
jgi:ABC-type sulfate transport system substrate-binding protein